MAVRKLQKPEWHGYFDSLSKSALAGKRVEVTIASPQSGAQVQAEWVPLLGVVYDEKDDILEIAMDGLDHLVTGPVEISVDEEAGLLSGFEVVDRSGVRHMVRLREPLTLTAPIRAE